MTVNCKNSNDTFSVIPADAGILLYFSVKIPAFAGMTCG
jgi:hypothetical protein